MGEPDPVLPGTLAQIRKLPASTRPLIVCDVDEVILHMILHLEAFLNAQGLDFLKYEYRLTGNIGEIGSSSPITPEKVKQLLSSFFDEIAHQQQMVPGAANALHSLASDWDIVLLTNLPGSHNKSSREELLAGFGISFPVVTNSGPKGGAVAALSAGRKTPLVFIDDSPTNHSSVKASLPAAHQIQFIADERFLKTAPCPSYIDLLTGCWQETSDYIGGIL